MFSLVFFVIAALNLINGYFLAFLLFGCAGFLTMPSQYPKIVKYLREPQNSTWREMEDKKVKRYINVFGCFFAFFGFIAFIANIESDPKLWDGVSEEEYLTTDNIEKYCQIEKISPKLDQLQRQKFGDNPAEALVVGQEYVADGKFVVYPKPSDHYTDGVDNSLALFEERKILPQGTVFQVIERNISEDQVYSVEYKVYLTEVDEYMYSDSTHMMAWQNIADQVLNHAHESYKWRDIEFSKLRKKIWPDDYPLKYIYMVSIANNHQVICD